MTGQPEPAQSTGLGKKVEAPVVAKETRRHVHGHIYEVDGKLVNEQPTPAREMTPAEQFFDLFVKNANGLF